MDRNTPSYGRHLRDKYKEEMLNAIRGVKCEGCFDFGDNGYCFLSVSANFAHQVAKIMQKEGFGVRYQIRKNRFPGKASNNNKITLEWCILKYLQ